MVMCFAADFSIFFLLSIGVCFCVHRATSIDECQIIFDQVVKTNRFHTFDGPSIPLALIVQVLSESNPHAVLVFLYLLIQYASTRVSYLITTLPAKASIQRLLATSNSYHFEMISKFFNRTVCFNAQKINPCIVTPFANNAI